MSRITSSDEKPQRTDNLSRWVSNVAPAVPMTWTHAWNINAGFVFDEAIVEVSVGFKPGQLFNWSFHSLGSTPTRCQAAICGNAATRIMDYIDSEMAAGKGYCPHSKSRIASNYSDMARNVRPSMLKRKAKASWSQPQWLRKSIKSKDAIATCTGEEF